MHPGALRALEFDRIVEAVRGFALTPLGAARLAALQPLDRSAAAWPQLLAATTETARFLAGNGAFPLRAPADLDADPRRAGGRRTRARAAAAARAGRRSSIRSTTTRAGDPPRARRRSRCSTRSPSAARLVQARDRATSARKIDPSGEVVDDASPELKAIRDRLRKQRTRLRGTLESYLRGKDTAKYLQEQVVTERNGRYVLVVAPSIAPRFPASSTAAPASGASLFLEPLSTVEINNDIVALEAAGSARKSAASCWR